MELSGSKIKYLLMIHTLSLDKGSARSVDISIRLGVARPTVHKMLGHLADMGLVNMKPRGAVTLTEQGLCTAERYSRRYTALKPFFSDFLGLSGYDAKQLAIAAISHLPESCIDALCAKAANI